MKIIKHLLLLLLFAFIVSSCGVNSNEISTIRTADDVREDFKNLIILPGDNDITLESTIAGKFWNFRIIAPIDASETNKRPLILSLHGGASVIRPDAHKATSCLVETGFENLNAYIISPNSNGYFWYDQPNQVQVLALLDLVKSNLLIDENKVLITGYSDGGNGSWFYAQYYPDLITAAIPMASSYNSVGSNGVVPKINIPLYVIHGENDDLFPLAQTQEWVNQSIDAGSDIKFIIASGLDHYQSCNYVGYLSDAVDWLQNEVWNQ